MNTEPIHPPQFFILGSQRSGTTLLRLMLNQHPFIAVPEEASFLMPLMNAKNLGSDQYPQPGQVENFIRYLSGNDQFRKWKLDVAHFDALRDKHLTWVEIIRTIYSTYAVQHHKVICGDKTPSFIRKIDAIAAAFPQAKFIHIVRDGRDLYLSMKNRRHPAAWSAASFALEWKTKLAYIKRVRAVYPERFLEIRYEDLLADPQACLKRLCEFLGIEYLPVMLDFWKTSAEFIDVQHSQLIFNPIQKENSEKWKTNMVQREREVFIFLARSTLAEMGYPAHDVVSMANKLIALWQLAIFVPARLARIAIIAVYMKIAVSLGWQAPQILYS